jgi:hypothetical protein
MGGRTAGRPAGRAAAWLGIALVAAGAGGALADEVPAGTLGAVFGTEAGTSGAYQQVGIGVVYGLTAAWQPMKEDQRIGWGVRWTTLFGYFPAADAAPVNGVLRLVQMDLVARLRVAPTLKPGRYLTVGVGASLERSSEPVCRGGSERCATRSFAGPVATLGYEHNAWGAVLIGLDLRYGPIEAVPASIGLLVSVGTAL